jgi:hypothetical protein
MDKVIFARNFGEAIRRALELADLEPTGMSPVVEFHGKPNPPRPISVNEALDLLWLSVDRYYQIVDVGAFSGATEPPVLFVRISGHEPSAYSNTWYPTDLGPFKAIGPVTRGLV